MKMLLEDSWKHILQKELEKPYFRQLQNFVDAEYETQTIYPPKELVFNALNLCNYTNVKVIILGQDPYHGEGQAHGLSFSVRDNVRFPPSLRNIYKEIQADLGIPIPESGNLSHWAKQGVLLLNATLTVRANAAGSHQKKGWEQFTDAIIAHLSTHKTNLVFMLWGAYAQKKGSIIDSSKHLVLNSVHPSPLSASKGFFGNHHFSLCNTYLSQHGISPIEWENKASKQSLLF